MDISQTLTLSVVQGITEFLPVSSSAHLVLITKLFAWPEQGIDFDIILHVGTLIAVLLYFRKELIKLLNPFYNLTHKIILATLPVCFAGLIFKDYIELYLRKNNIALVIAFSTIFFGLLLGFAQSKERNNIHNFHNITYWQSFLIGCAQCFALIPGASRLGLTMTMAMLLGVNRKAAAEFSFLLSIPVISLSGLKVAYELTRNPALMTAGVTNYLLGLVAAALVAVVSMNLFMKLLNKIGILPFVVYRLILGSVILGCLILNYKM
ncbi:MAG: undecaprenyl-diphosphate phosphatase [Gammaproteobacteria bacterium]|nr:undecaprenyl-diphosphate phosphatase [Gammaproteobacteria bacterium]